MHFIINKNHLVNGIQHVSKAVSSKTTIPILTGIKFEINNKGLILIGSDSDITIQIFIPTFEDDKEIIRVIKNGQLVLPKYIIDIVKKLPSDEIEFNLVDNLTVVIKSGSSEFRLNGYDAEEFPVIPPINDTQMFNIQSQLLKTMIRQTIFAVSTVESRPILTGVLWQLKDKNLRFVSTDSHRLALREAIIECVDNLTFNNIVLPGKSLTELNKILPDDESPVNIIVTDNQVIIKSNNLLLLTRIIDGTYPDISRIIPDKGLTNIIIETKILLDAIERASLLAKDSKNNIVKLSSFDNNLIEISSNLPEVGKVTEHLTANEVIGEDIKISFNSKYTLDALKAIDSQQITIEFTGALSPFVIKPLDQEKMLHLILPIRT